MFSEVLTRGSIINDLLKVQFTISGHKCGRRTKALILICIFSKAVVLRSNHKTVTATFLTPNHSLN